MNTCNAVRNFFENERQRGVEIHALVIYRGGKKLFSGAPYPYTANQKNHVYSLSKSFCSTALGIACDRGYLSLDERIVDIFPDKLPENISQNLSHMTLRHVLSMNTGHGECVMNYMVTSDDPVRAFLAQEVKYAPGTHFTYNTGATFLASACLTRRTGLSVLDFLELNLFKHMDINDSEWYSHCGISEGGVGFHVSCEDAAKLGLLYLNGGKYAGKQLISEEYVRLATSAISDNSGNGTPDWTSGYGLQFWINSRGGFRGDGAFGQLCMVFPEKDTVIACIAEGADMQSEVDGVYDLLDDLGENTEPVCENDLSEYLSSYYAPGIFSAEFDGIGKAYRLSENRSGFTVVRFEKLSDTEFYVYLTSKNSKIHRIMLKSGEWTHGVLCGNYVKPTIEMLTANFDGELSYAACARISDGALTITLRALNCPHNITFTFAADGKRLLFSRAGGGQRGYSEDYAGEEINL